MAKITGKIIHDLINEADLDMSEAGFTFESESDSWEQCDEHTQEHREALAKRLNDYLTYGLLPKKVQK